MKVFFDTNVVLDVLLAIKPFFEISLEAIKLTKAKRITGFVTASSITDVYYLMNKEFKDPALSIANLSSLLKVLKVAKVDERIIKAAVGLHWEDFEDAVQFAAAKRAGAKAIVTRNERDFAAWCLRSKPMRGDLAVYTSQAFVVAMS